MAPILQRPAFDMRFLQILKIDHLSVTEYQINAAMQELYTATVKFHIDKESILELERLMGAQREAI